MGVVVSISLGKKSTFFVRGFSSVSLRECSSRPGRKGRQGTTSRGQISVQRHPGERLGRVLGCVLIFWATQDIYIKTSERRGDRARCGRFLIWATPERLNRPMRAPETTPARDNKSSQRRANHAASLQQQPLLTHWYAAWRMCDRGPPAPKLETARCVAPTGGATGPLLFRHVTTEWYRRPLFAGHPRGYATTGQET